MFDDWNKSITSNIYAASRSFSTDKTTRTNSCHWTIYGKVTTMATFPDLQVEAATRSTKTHSFVLHLSSRSECHALRCILITKAQGHTIWHEISMGISTHPWCGPTIQPVQREPEEWKGPRWGGEAGFGSGSWNVVEGGWQNKYNVQLKTGCCFCFF